MKIRVSYFFLLFKSYLKKDKHHLTKYYLYNIATIIISLLCNKTNKIILFGYSRNNPVSGKTNSSKLLCRVNQEVLKASKHDCNNWEAPQFMCLQ